MEKVCDQCALVRINGVLCHEHGCPNAWRDTQKTCVVCGFEFWPESKLQGICNPCLDSMDEVVNDNSL